MSESRLIGSLYSLLVTALMAVTTDGSAQTLNHFELIGTPPVNIPGLQGLFNDVFNDVIERVGVSPDEKVNVAFEPANSAACRRRGGTIAHPRDQDGNPAAPIILIFTDESATADQILGVLAHEVGHVLQERVLSTEGYIASIFNEGFATWAAGPYWLTWHGMTSFQTAVADYIAAGTYLPLHQNDGFLDTLSESAASRFGKDCLNQRDIIYTEWAAFIDYLVDEHGREKLYSLFQVPPLLNDDDEGTFRKPNFPAVYGSSLERLESEWLDSISRD